MTKFCFLDLLELRHESNMRKEERRAGFANNWVVVFFLIFINAFITASFTSHSELKLTSFFL